MDACKAWSCDPAWRHRRACAQMRRHRQLGPESYRPDQTVLASDRATTEFSATNAVAGLIHSSMNIPGKQSSRNLPRQVYVEERSSSILHDSQDSRDPKSDAVAIIKSGGIDAGKDFGYITIKPIFYGRPGLQKNDHCDAIGNIVSQSQVNSRPAPDRNVVPFSKQPISTDRKAKALAAARDRDLNGGVSAFLDLKRTRVPDWFYQIQSGSIPNLKAVSESLPILELCRLSDPSNAGVIRIRSISYGTHLSEIISFISTNMDILHQPRGFSHFAAYITMERDTARPWMPLLIRRKTKLGTLSMRGGRAR